MSTEGAARFPASLLLLGAGKMGGALLDGWLRLGLDPAAISIIDPEPDPRLVALAQETGLRLGAPDAPPEAILLAVKPQMLEEALPSLQRATGSHTLVISILAGKTLANLAARLGETIAIVRAMPNLPASIGRGITGAVANAHVSDAQRQSANALLAAVGSVEWLDDEGLIDALTAVSGSGPAYVFYLAECLAEAGIEAGLPADLAARLARATVEGAGALLAQSPSEAAELRRNVTSPGGTTAAAIEVLMAGEGMEPLLKKAVLAAKRRAGELSG